MDLSVIEALMAKLEASKLKRLVYKQGDFELVLEKESEAPFVHPVHPSMPPKQHFEPSHDLPPPKRPVVEESPGSFVTSPMVGTFYSSPSPGEPSFVKVGDVVREDTVVCIIEAMKVLNEVKAGVSGTVAEVLIDNGQPVEFGTRLFRVV